MLEYCSEARALYLSIWLLLHYILEHYRAELLIYIYLPSLVTFRFSYFRLTYKMHDSFKKKTCIVTGDVTLVYKIKMSNTSAATEPVKGQQTKRW